MDHMGDIKTEVWQINTAMQRNMRSLRSTQQKSGEFSGDERRQADVKLGSNRTQAAKDVTSSPDKDDLPMDRLRRAFGRNDYLLPENFKTLRRSDIPVTYRLHDDLLRYYRDGKFLEEQ
ncbi:hypothetical protein TELCIR_04928 [Teladorsagia circumcincta]|uniref:Uncharacterized protein n=1 Tax=Teladorsagia circumcincta TaxID=45464 RepID=A0A2G9UUC4_TELCI|nr:hypothetical protein TELCIR_04928 [Teladorsagia circumcincta]